MNDPGPVRFRHRHAGLEDPVDGLVHRQRSTLLQLRLEVAPAEALHDHVRAAPGVGVDVEHVDHVGAAHATAGARLALETLHGVDHRQHIRTEELDGHALAQAEVLGLEDHAHPAGPEHPRQAVLPSDHLTGSRDGRSRRVVPPSTTELD